VHPAMADCTARTGRKSHAGNITVAGPQG
jgi:hypothetical protein